MISNNIHQKIFQTPKTSSQITNFTLPRTRIFSLISSTQYYIPSIQILIIKCQHLKTVKEWNLLDIKQRIKEFLSRYRRAIHSIKIKKSANVWHKLNSQVIKRRRNGMRKKSVRDNRMCIKVSSSSFFVYVHKMKSINIEWGANRKEEESMNECWGTREKKIVCILIFNQWLYIYIE